MQRAATKQSPGPTAQAKRFQSLVAQLPCVMCGNDGGVILDHIWGSSRKLYVGSIRVHVGHFAVIPLCALCDSVKTNGSHRSFAQIFGQTQQDVWVGMVYANNLMRHMPEKVLEAIERECLPF